MSAVRYAWEAAQAMESLASVTGTPQGYESPEALAGAVEALGVVAEGIPRVLVQTATWLEAAHQQGRVGHDQDLDPAMSVYIVCGYLNTSQVYVTSLARGLWEAHKRAAHLRGVVL